MSQSPPNIAAIAVGSNINPDYHIALARQKIVSNQKLLAESDFVLTAPVGEIDQPDFRNGAWLIETTLDVNPLRIYLKEVETATGRQPSTNKYGPREIDLDIVVWNGEIIDPDFYERKFLQRAIGQLLPDLPVD
jgi:2-amino-4-hydroxy-6-hydroxymethyldihydropteridine diphosphokinase